ncbi:MAG TPA: hypothetical protein GXX57_11460 [Firmicutes bacterium]|nr:hypothetical protein [Bacillota bacterium]
MEKVEVLQTVVPESRELIERRYIILRNIYFSQPVGRRALAAKLDLSERTIRREVEVLRQQGLVEPDPLGMQLTPEGEAVLASLTEFLHDLLGLGELERSLEKLLNLKEVIVVPGDSDRDETIKKEIAKATARFLLKRLHGGQVLVVTGGTTLAEVARYLPPLQDKKEVVVVPGRGGLGENVELQANTIAAAFANHLGGTYRLLHVPDDLDQEVLSTICNEPNVREIVDLIRSADMVLHGIGTAQEMARRRALSAEQRKKLFESDAVGEAFGYYFNKQGEIVYSVTSAGLHYHDLANIGLVVAVGGGHTKADAIVAVLSRGYQDVLITDEGAARKIHAGLTGNAG